MKIKSADIKKLYEFEKAFLNKGLSLHDVANIEQVLAEFDLREICLIEKALRHKVLTEKKIR